jgi:hypothetical protein
MIRPTTLQAMISSCHKENLFEDDIMNERAKV